MKKGNFEDSEILKLKKKKPEEAFRKLMAQYRDQVFLICRRVTDDKFDAEDLAQDVFIRIWRALDAFRGDSALSTWIYRIAWNVCASYLSSKKKASMFSSYDESENDDEQVSISHSLGSCDRSYDDMEQKQLIETVFKSLSETHRLVLTLFYLKEQNYEEICSITGMPMGTLKATLHRAKEKMRYEVTKELSKSTR